MISYAPFCTTERKHIVNNAKEKSSKEVKMGIEEAVRNLCNKKPKLRSVVIGTRFSEEERDQIRAKAAEIGNGANSCDVIRGSLIANGIIKGDEACPETTK